MKKITVIILCVAMLVAFSGIQGFAAGESALTVYDDSDEKIGYEGSWTAFSVASASEGTVHSAAEYASIIMTFTDCTVIKVYGGIGTDRGRYKVYLDGKLFSSGDSYSQELKTGVLFADIKGLEKGKHTVRLEATGQKSDSSSSTWLEFDKVESDGKLMPYIVTDSEEDNQIIDDTLVEYRGVWSAYSMLDASRGFYKNTATSATAKGISAMYTFACCTGIKWYSTTGSAYSTADVYIDGEKVASLDIGAMKAGRPSAVFDSGELPAGQHSIMIVNTGDGSKYLEVDRLIGVGNNDAGYSVVNARNNNFFVPFGKRMENDNGSLTIDSTGSGVLLSFCGDMATINGTCDGTYRTLLDGKEADSAKDGALFKVSGLAEGNHTVKLILEGGTATIENAFVRSPKSVASILSDAANEEMELIKNNKKQVLDASLWRPVKKGAVMPINGVTLNNGVLKNAFDRNINYIKYCFGKSATKYADVTSIWTDSLAASTEGRMLSGAGNSLRFTQDAELEKVLDTLLTLAAERAEKSGDGWCMPYEKDYYALHPGDMIDEDKNYDRVMYTRGLVGAVKAGRQDAEVLLRDFYDWFNQCEYLPDMLLGGLGTQGSLGTVLAYESSVGKPEDLYTNMRYYDMDWFIDGLINRTPETIYRFPLNRPHSYLLVSVQSLLGEYTATGKEEYLNAALGAWDIFMDGFVTTGGGICICEGPVYLPGNYTLDTSHGVYENCGNVFWTEFNARLLELFPGEEKYAAQMEQCIYNMLLASQDTAGKIRYFQLYNGTKYGAGAVNSCCENMACGQIAMLPQYIYSVADDGLYINLFSDSSIDFTANQTAFKLTQTTDFPFDNKVALKISGIGTMKLRIRIPQWNNGDVKIMLNGSQVGTGKAGEYFVLERSFNNDEISFLLNPTVETHNYIGETQIEGKNRCAVTYGPILLACKGSLNLQHTINDTKTSTIELQITEQQLKNNLVRNEKLQFSIEGIKGYTFVPYYSIQSGSFAVFPAISNAGSEPENTPLPDNTEAPETPQPTATTQPKPGKGVLPAILGGIAVLCAAGGAIALIAGRKHKKA